MATVIFFKHSIRWSIVVMVVFRPIFYKTCTKSGICIFTIGCGSSACQAGLINLKREDRHENLVFHKICFRGLCVNYLKRYLKRGGPV
jgi:hypothetical protein